MEKGNQCTDSLTVEVLSCQKLFASSDAQSQTDARLLLDKISHQVWLIAYYYPVLVKVLDEEDAAEFVIGFRNRIPTIIKEFRYEFLTFESYIKKVVFWQSNSFIQRKRKREKYFSCDPNDPETIQRILTVSEHNGGSFYRQTNWDALLVNEEEYYYDEGKQWNLQHPICKELKERMKKSKTLRNRLLQLVLLCADKLSTWQIECLALFLSMNEKKLAHLIAQAIEKGYRRVEINDEIRGVRDFHFHDFLKKQLELESLVSTHSDPYVISMAQQRYERSKKLFKQRCLESRQRPRVVTHAVIAALMQTPKGTVDSGLQSLKKTLREVIDAYT